MKKLREDKIRRMTATIQSNSLSSLVLYKQQQHIRLEYIKL
jgi:hypothetical protein